MANERTTERRHRVKELFAKRDRTIAEILIEEQFFGEIPRTRDARKRHLDTARRQVHRDREWWRAEWRKERKELAGDVRVSREEFIARLESRLQDAEEIIASSEKPTPRVQALDAAVRIEVAIAKARGVSEITSTTPGQDETGPRPPFLGIVVGFDNLSPEGKSKIDEWLSSREY